VPAVRCILCGKGLTKGELAVLTDAGRFLEVFSLSDKILKRIDGSLKSYAAHATPAQSVLALGNGWHQIACFSHTEYRVSRMRTVGVLNGKLYWDDFLHFHCEQCKVAHQALTPREINHLLGITPAKRKSIPAKMRKLVLERHGGKCARCGTAKEIEVHHRLPVVHGGVNDPDKLVPLCCHCHTYHPGEFTERIWPDLEAIFLASEGVPGRGYLRHLPE
jgi:5-methylcytosine-specific restriction endonuclease McrA